MRRSPGRRVRGHLRRHAALADGRRARCSRCCRTTSRGRSTRGTSRSGVVDRRVRAAPAWPAARSPGGSPIIAAASPWSCSARCSRRSPASSTSLPTGLPGLIGARLVLGAGRGHRCSRPASAWVVDLAPPGRRGRVIGLYGLAVWSGLSIGPPIGELLYHASSFDARLGVRRRGARSSGRWSRFASRTRSSPRRTPRGAADRPRVDPARRSALSLATVGYAAMASFIVLDLDSQRRSATAPPRSPRSPSPSWSPGSLGGDLPDRIGPLRCAAGAAAVESLGLALIALSTSLPMAIVGALAMGAAFSLLYPSLSLVVVNQVPEAPARRGARHLHRRSSTSASAWALRWRGSPRRWPATRQRFWLASGCALGTLSVALGAQKSRGCRPGGELTPPVAASSGASPAASSGLRWPAPDAARLDARPRRAGPAS